MLRCVTFCFQHASFPNEGFWTFVSFHSTFHFIAYLYSTHFYPNFKYIIHDKSDYYNETLSLDIWNSKAGIAFTYFYKTKKQMHISCRIHFIVNKKELHLLSNLFYPLLVEMKNCSTVHTYLHWLLWLFFCLCKTLWPPLKYQLLINTANTVVAFTTFKMRKMKEWRNTSYLILCLTTVFISF